MTDSFFKELNSEKTSGVAYKNLNLKKGFLTYFAQHKSAIISELSKEFRLSVPKATKILNDLIEEGLIEESGRLDSTGGRKPVLYCLSPDSGFFLAVDVKQAYINLGLMDFQNNLIELKENYPYHLENNQDSLEKLCDIINHFIGELLVPKNKILGIGLNLSGRINYATGYSYSFFYFQEDPLSQIVESNTGIPVFLENDSHAMAYGEFFSGVVNDEKDVLFLNLDYGLGMGIMLNRELYLGKSGYSGEFGHIPLFDNEVICRCGKKGCLETEASGWALIKMFQEELKEGSSTSMTRKNIKPENIKLDDIINAVDNDDVLAIELIAKVGEHLGKAIAILINIFNPELIILGGSLASTKDYIRLPIQSSINKYSLSRVSTDTKIKVSLLGNKAGVIGACLLVRNRILALS